VTPTYNHEAFIGECIESIVRQSYVNWEQIIIDDGSTDRTAEIVKRYCEPRVRYYRQENQGPDALARTYNRALSESRGELIAILEGDDLWPSHKLSVLVPRFDDPDVVLAYGAVMDIDPRGRAAKRRQSYRWRTQLGASTLTNDPIGTAVKFMLSARGPSLIPASTVILRRSVLERIGGFQSFAGLRTTDYPTYLRLGLEGKFAFEAEIMGIQRRHLGSLTTANIEGGREFANDCAVDFCNVYGSRIGLTLRDQSLIEASWEDSRAIVEFSVGRVALLKRDWRKARRHFYRAVLLGQVKIRCASGIGWLLSWFHRDLERLMHLAGRPSLK